MTQTHLPAAEWSGARKALFRLCFLFFTLYIFFNPNGFIPFTSYALMYYIRPFHRLIPWIGAHILHLSHPITKFNNGSGDTTFDWVMMLMIIVLAFAGAVVWSVIDRRRPHYNTLLYWLNVLVRYYFAFTMFNYGMTKLFKVQFRFPGQYGLMETYGNSSPMRLAWNFLGYSTGYNYFMGFAEVTSGLLLMFRRTVRLGAIVSLVVAANIMAINYSFDVCVKLLSTVLVIMAIFLLLQGWEYHLNYFFLNKDVRPQSLTRPEFQRKWVNKALGIVKYVLIIWVMANTTIAMAKVSNLIGDASPKPPLYGVYDVQTFVRNKDTVLQLTTDTLRWRRLIMDRRGSTVVQLMNDSVQFYTNTTDTILHTLKIVTNGSNNLWNANFAYSNPDKDGLLLTGRWIGDSVRVTLKRFDMDSLLLVRRGFHWINEQPFNR